MRPPYPVMRHTTAQAAAKLSPTAKENLTDRLFSQDYGIMPAATEAALGYSERQRTVAFMNAPDWYHDMIGIYPDCNGIVVLFSGGGLFFYTLDEYIAMGDKLTPKQKEDPGAIKEAAMLREAYRILAGGGAAE